MEFKSWLNKNEGLWRSPTQALSATDYLKKQEPVQNHGYNIAKRDDNRFQDREARVNYGMGIEKQIFNSLVACGMKLRDATQKEDMYDKIDGWWDTGHGEEAIQIKYRDTGKDVLFEVMKDWDRKIPGRDMIGKATYYAVLRPTGDIVVVSVLEAKKIIQAALNAINSGAMKNNIYKMKTGSSMAEFRITTDPSSRQQKLMAYIPVDAFKNIRPPCKGNIKF